MTMQCESRLFQIQVDKVTIPLLKKLRYGRNLTKCLTPTSSTAKQWDLIAPISIETSDSGLLTISTLIPQSSTAFFIPNSNTILVFLRPCIQTCLTSNTLVEVPRPKPTLPRLSHTTVKMLCQLMKLPWLYERKLLRLECGSITFLNDYPWQSGPWSNTNGVYPLTSLAGMKLSKKCIMKILNQSMIYSTNV